MGMLLGWFFILFGVIFFFAGGGGSVISAILGGRLASIPQLKPQVIFACVGFAIWLLGAIMMLVGGIAARKRARN